MFIVSVDKLLISYINNNYQFVKPILQIRVPTHQNGTSLFWEFATDDLDIGFGLSFEWSDQELKPGI